MATANLRINLPNRSCDVIIRDGVLSNIPLSLYSNPSSIIVVSDSNVGEIYGGRVKDSLEEVAKTELVTFPAGEASKKLETVDFVAGKMNEFGLDRNGAVVALGGGVVGDLVGFTASIYKRGVEYFQVPTTLLAQVDSSIGGKTGVNTRWGKNQLGTFYQPRAVFSDPSVLDSLPKDEVINGLAEIVKSAILADRKMFMELSEILKKDGVASLQSLKRFILDTCKIKADVVSRDEKEENVRVILNYGHTVGHAIEASSEYSTSHGKAVILGMIAEGWAALKLGIFDRDDFEKQEELLRRIVDKSQINFNYKKDELVQYAFSDKKSISGVIRMSLPERIGEMHATKEGSYKIPIPVELFNESIEHLSSIFLK